MNRDSEKRQYTSGQQAALALGLLAGLQLMTFPLLAQEGSVAPMSDRIVPERQQAQAAQPASMAAIERKVMQVLSREQVEDLRRGADPNQILVPGGETLTEFIGRLAHAAATGLVYRAVSPCLVFDSRKAGAKLRVDETLALLVRGRTTDYSAGGGSADGCAIPGLRGEVLKTNTARALFLQVEVFDAEGPGELVIWPAGQLEPRSGLLTYSGQSDTSRLQTSAVVPMCDEERTEPCASGDLYLKSLGAGAHVAISVLGYLELPSTVFQGNIQIESLSNPNHVLFVGQNANFGFVNSYDLSAGRGRDLYLNGRVGIKTTRPQADLHVSGGAGSVELLVEADTDNAGSESDQPRITLSQDGGLTQGSFGYFDATNDLEITNGQGNAKVVLKANGDICIGTGC